MSGGVDAFDEFRGRVVICLFVCLFIELSMGEIFELMS